MKRTPLSRIQQNVSKLLVTSSSTKSGSARFCVTRAMSSKNCSRVYVPKSVVAISCAASAAQKAAFPAPTTMTSACDLAMWPLTPCLQPAAYAEISAGHDLPLDRFPAAIDQRLFIGPFDLDLLRWSPRGFFQRDRRFIRGQAIVPGTVNGRKVFELVERAFLLKYFRIGLDRDRRVEHAGDAVHRELLRHRMGRGVGAQK